MGIIFRIFFFFTLLGLGLLLLLSWFLQQKGSLSPSKPSYKEQNITLLKKTLEDMLSELIPIDIHEFKILSWKLLPLNQSNKVQAGYIQTIFQEKLFAYSISHNSEDCLVEVLSSNANYTFEQEDNNTKVFLSDKFMGTIDAKNRFNVVDELMYSFQLTYSSPTRVIISSGNESIVQIYLGENSDSFSESDRLITVLNKLEEREYEILIVLVLYILLVKNKTDV